MNLKEQQLQEIIKTYFPEDVEVISTSYGNTDTPIYFKCRQCKKEYHITLTAIKKGQNKEFICKGCREKIAAEKGLKSTDFFKSYFTNQGVELLTPYYQNNRSQLEYRCICGNIWHVQVAEVTKLQEFRCPTCRRNRLSCSEEFLSKLLQDHNSSFRGIIKNSKSTSSNVILFTCENCGAEISSTFGNISRRLKGNKRLLCGDCSGHKSYSIAELNERFFLT